MGSQPNIAEELESRIEKDVGYFQGTVPERYTIAWRGYLAALLEWNVIETSVYDQLLDLLPKVDDDPAVAILRGRD